MSLSNINMKAVKSPVAAILEWDAMEGKFRYYDTESKQRKFIDDTTFNFVVLDQLSNVSGWVSDLGVCRAEETHNLNASPIEVKSWKDGKSTTVKKGMYKDIKDGLKTMGIKYRKIVYGMIVFSDEFSTGSIVKLDLGGCAMSQWIESNINDGNEVSFGLAEEVQLNKMVSYKKPTFKVSTPTEDVLSEAKEIDRELQEFFDSRKQKVSVAKEENVSEEYDDDVPF